MRCEAVALIFQYGSNMSAARLNSSDRLRDDAHPIGIAYTKDNYELEFDIWSESNDCAAADIVRCTGRKIWGIVYEIPDWLISRDTAGSRKSLDEIEGEGTNYSRLPITLCYSDCTPFRGTVQTYIGRDRRQGIKTSLKYVRHILLGLKEHKNEVPNEYVQYVKDRITVNNPDLRDMLNSIEDI